MVASGHPGHSEGSYIHAIATIFHDALMSSFPSSDFMGVGIVLLRLNYVNVALAFLWVYDYFITISSEVAFLFHGQWGKAKMMYLVCRYVPFAFITLDILSAIQPGLSQTLCQVYHTSNAYIGYVVLFCAECIFITRACALWGYRRSIVVFFVITTVLYFCLSILILASYTSGTIVTITPIPSVSCVNTSENLVIMAAYCLLMLEELETLFLSLYKAIASFRRCRHGNRLLEILIHHNIFYFASGLCFSATVILCAILMQESYGNTIANAHVIFHALLVTRMHRDLWRTDRNIDLSQSLDSIALTTLGIASAWSQ